MDVWVRVTPGASHPQVGGRYGEDEPALLIVRVRERAVDGAANAAVVRDLAKAFDVPTAQVELVSGAGSRRKRVRIRAQDQAQEDRLQARRDTLLSGVSHTA